MVLYNNITLASMNFTLGHKYRTNLFPLPNVSASPVSCTSFNLKFNKNFHSTSILNFEGESEEMAALEKRLNDLKNTDLKTDIGSLNENAESLNEEEILSSQIRLMSTDETSLREAFLTAKEVDTEKFSDAQLDLMNSSSFEESFPDISNLDAELKSDVFKSLHKVYDLDSNILNKLIKDYGLLFLRKKFQNVTANEAKDEDLKKISDEIDKLNLNNIPLSEFNNIDSVEKLLNISNKVDNGLNAMLNVLEIFKKNQNNFDVLTGTISILSPFMVWRGVLSTYTNVIMPEHLMRGANVRQLENLIELRKRHIRSFNKISIPIIFGYFIYMQTYHKMFNLNISKYDISIIPFLGLNQNKKNKWFSLLFISVIGIIIIWLLPFIIKNTSPSLYEKLLLFNLYYSSCFKYLVFIWLIFWYLSYLLELFFFIKFSLSSETYKDLIGKKLPSFILNWLQIIEKDSKSEIKDTIFNIYIKIILFFSVLISLYFYLFI